MLESFYKIILIAGVIFASTSFAFAQTEGQKGIELYRQGKNQEAAAVLKKASKTEKTDPEVWNYLGLVYTKEENYKQAVKSFEKAVALNAQNAGYQTNLAYVYFLTNKLDKAQSASTKAIALNPQSVNAFYIRGAASVWKGDTDAAIKDADEAIRLNENYSQAYTLKSDALMAIFGRRVSLGAKPSDEVALLRQAQDALETCLKNCRDNAQMEIQKKRFDSLQVFYKYFNRNKETRLEQADVAANQPAIVAPVSDPSITRPKILKKPRPEYAEKARRNGITGTVRLAIIFSENGRVSDILILQGLGGGLTETALEAARRIEFEPARKDGKPISKLAIVEYSFDIR